MALSAAVVAYRSRRACRPAWASQSPVRPRFAGGRAGRDRDMNDQQLLIQAIIANPDEDTPRLAYADWLDENATTDAQRGRAEFIRVQCRLAATPDDPERDALYAREVVLRRLHVPEWAAFVSGRGIYRPTFRRGFVEAVSATAHAFATRGAAWCAQTPLREACITAVAGRGDRLATAPHLNGLAALTVEDARFGDDELAALAASPYLDGLRDLSIRGHADCGTLVTDQGSALWHPLRSCCGSPASLFERTTGSVRSA